MQLIVKEVARARGINSITELQNRTFPTLAYNTVRAYWIGRVERIDINTLNVLARAIGVNPKDLLY